MQKLFLVIFAALALSASLSSAQPADFTPYKSAAIAPDSRCFEMRVYYAAPGKLEALNARFRDYTNKLFVKHGMALIGYWMPTKAGQVTENKLVYILAYPSPEAREKAWKDFGSDPEWKDVVKKTEANGRLVTKVDSTIMSATDYSAIK